MLGLLVNSSNSSEGNVSSNTNFVYDKMPKTIAYCLLFLISIVGNSLIVWIIYKDKRLRNTTNFLVANMAVSDLLANIFLSPSAIMAINFDHRWLITNVFGLALCKLHFFVGDTSNAVSLYSCVFIAIDRYYAVAHPLKGGFTRSRLKYIIPGIWIYSGLITSPYLYYFRLVIRHDMAYCDVEYEEFSQQRINFFTLVVLTAGVPLPIITTLYILIVYKLRHHRVPGNQTDLSKRRREQQIRKALKMSATIVILLYISYLFGSIFSVLLVVGHLNNLTVDIRSNLSFTTVFIMRLSFAYNFFIYVIFNDVYRDNVKAVITRLCCEHRTRDATAMEADGQELGEIR